MVAALSFDAIFDKALWSHMATVVPDAAVKLDDSVRRGV